MMSAWSPRGQSPPPSERTLGPDGPPGRGRARRDGTGLIGSGRTGEPDTQGRNNLPLLTANEVLLRATDEDFAADRETDRLCRRIALIATEQIDQGALIGYPSLDPAYAAFIETCVFYAARGVLES